ncbi:hypothetical protein [Paramicrobacterium fandaimingii]|uniref:hypothetical protein n=1 Tax=Paramicrobacterium fandaimingii TaxID=2708079 RepID=UPI00142418A4|nr:hypothetical protein [Microbacterium fandaimingii]
MSVSDADAAVAAVRAQLAVIVQQLTDTHVVAEPLAEFVPARRIALVFRRDSQLVETGRVWRLGVLLIDGEAGLFAAGETTRAVDPGWPQYQAQSMEVRREYRGAAMRGRFPEGSTININARPIDVSVESLTGAEGPVFLRNGHVRVRWSSHVTDDQALPLGRYLAERTELLLHPVDGA